MKLKKFLVSILLVALPISSVQAYVLNDNSIKMFVLELEGGVTLNFFTKEDRNSYLSELNSNNRNLTFDEVLSTTSFYDRYIAANPLTPNWSYADNYSISVTRDVNVSGSFEFKGANLTVGTVIQRGVTISLPANPDRASRLGVGSDFDIQLVRRKTIDSVAGIVLDTVEFYRVANVKNVTNFVEYR